jgi:hypothetical protein
MCLTDRGKDRKEAKKEGRNKGGWRKIKRQESRKLSKADGVMRWGQDGKQIEKTESKMDCTRNDRTGKEMQGKPWWRRQGPDRTVEKGQGQGIKGEENKVNARIGREQKIRCDGRSGMKDKGGLVKRTNGSKGQERKDWEIRGGEKKGYGEMD